MRSSTLPIGLIPVERYQVAFDRDQRCPYCHGGLEQDRAALVVCLDCRTLLHATCAEHHGGCTTRGCKRARTDERRRGSGLRRRPPLDAGRRWPLLLAVLFCGFSSWALGRQVGLELDDPAPVVVVRPPVPCPTLSLQASWLEGARLDASQATLRVAVEMRDVEPDQAEVAVGARPVALSWTPRGDGWHGEGTMTVPLRPGLNGFVVRASAPGAPTALAQLQVRVAAPERPLLTVGARPGPALVTVQAPARTQDETLFLRAVVAQQAQAARIEVRGPGGEMLVFDAVRPGDVQAAVTLPRRGRHTIEVRVTLPDGRSAVAQHPVVRQ